MLSAGTNVEWLRDDLALIATAAESDQIAAQCDDTDGVMFVPALLGLGTPFWDYGARGTLLGLTRGAGRPQVVRAVLEGVAQRGADLVDAAELDGTRDIPALRIDGGMSRNADLRPGAWPMPLSARSRCHLWSKRPRSGPRSWRASPSACGVAGTTSRPRGVQLGS